MDEPLKIPIEVRLAEPQDAATIADFTRNIAWETENIQLTPETVSDGVQAVFDDPGLGFYVVATNSGNIIGCLMVTYEWSDWRNGVQWWLQSVYVKSEFRRKGVFKQLWSFTINLASGNPEVCGMRLYVEKDNKLAQATYRSIGMQATNYLVYETTLKNT